VRRVSRSGRRAGSTTLVLHLVTGKRDDASADQEPPRVGFVVGRSVGHSVLRHRVQRRLRHLCRDRLADLPPGSEFVVRALAPAADASYQELAGDLDRCLERVLADSGPGARTVS
jgi:ribonuclease P protein component